MGLISYSKNQYDSIIPWHTKHGILYGKGWNWNEQDDGCNENFKDGGLHNSYGTRGCPLLSQPWSIWHFRMCAIERSWKAETQGQEYMHISLLWSIRRIVKKVRKHVRCQGRCKECQNKTRTWQCSEECEDSENTVFLYSTKDGKVCFVGHLACNHVQFDEFLE